MEKIAIVWLLLSGLLFFLFIFNIFKMIKAKK